MESVLDYIKMPFILGLDEIGVVNFTLCLDKIKWQLIHHCISYILNLNL